MADIQKYLRSRIEFNHDNGKWIFNFNNGRGKWFAREGQARKFGIKQFKIEEKMKVCNE